MTAREKSQCNLDYNTMSHRRNSKRKINSDDEDIPRSVSTFTLVIKHPQRGDAYSVCCSSVKRRRRRRTFFLVLCSDLQMDVFHFGAHECVPLGNSFGKGTFEKFQIIQILCPNLTCIYVFLCSRVWRATTFFILGPMNECLWEILLAKEFLKNFK